MSGGCEMVAYADDCGKPGNRLAEIKGGGGHNGDQLKDGREL